MRGGGCCGECGGVWGGGGGGGVCGLLGVEAAKGGGVVRGEWQRWAASASGRKALARDFTLCSLSNIPSKLH